MNWNNWSLDRVLILAMGLFFLVIFVQVTLFHYRQNFRHWSMWVPVIETPIFALCLVIFAFYNTPLMLTLTTILLCAGVLSGIMGSYVHVKGVGERVGGYELRNFLTGPPVTLPALITAVSVLGLIALYWGD